jgi:hypothetical protein
MIEPEKLKIYQICPNVAFASPSHSKTGCIAMRKLLTFLIALAVSIGASASSFGQVGQMPTYIQPPPAAATAPVESITPARKIED